MGTWPRLLSVKQEPFCNEDEIDQVDSDTALPLWIIRMSTCVLKQYISSSADEEFAVSEFEQFYFAFRITMLLLSLQTVGEFHLC